MKQVEVYKQFRQHHEHVAAWHDRIVMDILEGLHNDGFVDPKLYVLYYDYAHGEYGSTIIHSSKDRMTDPVAAQDDYELMRAIEKKIQYPVIAIMFTSEGTTAIEGSDERLSFLLITFETQIRGWKNLYRLQKSSFVKPDGSTVIVVKDAWHDPEASNGHSISQVERYSHIIRPNWSDQTLEYIYN